jgi:hypothetical protein
MGFVRSQGTLQVALGGFKGIERVRAESGKFKEKRPRSAGVHTSTDPGLYIRRIHVCIKLVQMDIHDVEQ